MKNIRAFSLVEIMVGLTLGVILALAIIGVYMAQKNIYKTSISQAAIQNAESAIAQLVTPVIRSAGFCGCSTALNAISNLNAGGPPPLGTINTTPSMIMGYGTATGSPMTITTDNAANSTTVTSWSPTLDASLAGNVQATSDVVIVLGPVEGSQPIGVTTETANTNTIVLQNANGLSVGSFAAISDCAKASIFAITATAGNTITHATAGGALANANGPLAVNYPPGSQVVPLTQTAFFVAHDPSGQSALVKGTLQIGGTWTYQSLIPGVDTMKVQYGIGTGGIPTQYVAANAVTNWGNVYSIRLGFLLEGQAGSETFPLTQYSVIGTTVNVPSDARLRHTFEVTIALRNSS